MSSTLKLCPFCGGDAELHATKTIAWVSCRNLNCNAEVGGKDSWADAIQLWNRRHDAA